MLTRCCLVAALLGAAVALTAVESRTDAGEKLQAEDNPDSKCASENGEHGEAAELSVESGLNATGHWLAKVRLQHAVSATISENGERSPVQLQLKRWARRAPREDSVRLVTLQATLTGPSTSLEEDLPSDDAKKFHFESESNPPKPTASSCPLPPLCPTCPTILTNSTAQSNLSTCPLPSPCPTCPSTPTSTPPQPCPSPCPVPPPCPDPPPCPACATAPPPPPPQKCPSPCPSPCPTPPPCPALPTLAPTPAPVKCPSPCPAAVACPKCPTCPSCPAPRSCPSPCATPPPCPACPSCPKPTPYGYKRVSGSNSAYRMHLIPLNWYDAQATCEREGGYLAIINTQAEADAINSLLSDAAYKHVDYFAIGIHDLHKEGSWYTVLDEPFHTIQYHKWARGEPNNDGNQDCGGLYRGQMALDDYGCHLQQAFLCELS